MTLTLRTLSGLAFVATTGLVHAEVTVFDAFKSVRYTQTSASAPVAPDSADFTARVFTDTDDDVITATLTTPNGTRGIAQDNPRLAYYQEGFFSSDPVADLEAAYPAGTYNFAVDTGNLAGTTGAIDLPETLLSNETPFLTNGSFAALTNAVEGQAIDVTWNPYTLSGTADDELVYFFVTDLSGGGGFGAVGDNGSYSGQLLDGSLFVAGHTYAWSLTYSARFLSNDGDFGSDATAIVGFDRATSGQFTVQAVPEPASMAALGLGALGLLRRRKASF